MGKLKAVSNGGIDVTVPGTLSDYTDFTMWVSEAVKVASAALGRDVYAMADHFAFCAPPDAAPNWGAVGLQNGNRINIHGKYCMSMSVLLHEFGHNFNLMHSGIGSDPYADMTGKYFEYRRSHLGCIHSSGFASHTCVLLLSIHWTGYMGGTAIASNGPRRCYNGYKSYQLRWYEDRHLNLRDFATPRKVQLAAFVDYRKTTASVHHVVVNLADRFFLQYNRAKGINFETHMMKNLVTVVSNEPNMSLLLAGLGAGKAWTTAYGGRTLYVAVCRRIDAPVGSTATVPDVMVLTIGYDRNWCGLI
jgi:hypothetical protein